MRLRLSDAWAGSKRHTAICPYCGSGRGRFSRRRYEEIWSRLLRVRPVKCAACGSYFPISTHARPAQAGIEHEDLLLPFSPVELFDPAGSHSARELDAAGMKWWQITGRVCPGCGSKSLRPGAALGGEPSLAQRLDMKDPYRCTECNRSFYRLNLLKFMAVGLLLVTVLGGLSFAVLGIVGRRQGTAASPRIRQNKVPKLPPPVFR